MSLVVLEGVGHVILEEAADEASKAKVDVFLAERNRDEVCEHV